MRIVIEVSGGVVQSVTTDADRREADEIDCLVVDRDIDGWPDGEIVQVGMNRATVFGHIVHSDEGFVGAAQAGYDEIRGRDAADEPPVEGVRRADVMAGHLYEH